MRKLQQDVIEWKALYDDLMQDFRSLKLKTVVEKEELIKEVKALKNKSGDTKVSMTPVWCHRLGNFMNFTSFDCSNCDIM